MSYKTYNNFIHKTFQSIFNLKTIFCSALIFVNASAGFAQSVSVTFQVDMRGLEISPDGVHLAGDFQQAAGFGGNWNPSATTLTDLEGDSIYSIQLNIPSGSYAYKYINGNQWIHAENPPSLCSFGGNNNRSFQVGSTDLIIPTVPFNACNPSVRFSLSLGDEPIDPNGLFVTGDFQVAAGFPSNWNTTQSQMFDYNSNGLYELVVSIPPGEYRYQYLNGGSIDAPEPIDSDCMDNDGYRTFTVENNQQIELWNCYGTCEICLPSDTATGISGWWNDVVFYEVFVRSFYDKVGNDGKGDFRGLIEKLDYLNDGDPNTDTDLGIGALWLMPMMKSPSYHGYDITDYYATHVDYGTMQDFEDLLDSCHARGIKVVIDHVMNHSSNQHPWFQQSAANQNNKRDWYVWSNNNPGFNGPWGQNVWHNHSSGFYYGVFWGGMPDLNYRNEAVKNELLDASDFWLAKGVDGFRLDAIKYLVEDGNQLENTPETFSLIEEFNQRFKAISEESFTIGEVWSSTSSVVPYVTGNKLDACFDFDLADRILNGVNTRVASGIKNQIETVVAAYPGQRYGTFLTNHDINRVMDYFQNNVEKMKSASAIYLTLPGIPFVYYGEEIGMRGSGPDEEKRKPMQWNTSTHAGFSTVTPWRAVGSNYPTNNVSTQAAQPNSLLNHYKRIIHLRNNTPALQRGKYLPVNISSNQCLSYGRSYGQQVMLMIHNLGLTELNPTLSLEMSTLPAGTYYVNDLYSQTNIGEITINGQGGFVDWQPTASIAEGKSWILSFDDAALPSSTKEISLESPYLFPNPTDGKLQFSGIKNTNLPIQVEVVDATGRQLLNTKINIEDGLDVSSFSPGLYWIHLISHEQNTVLPFVKTAD